MEVKGEQSWMWEVKEYKERVIEGIYIYIIYIIQSTNMEIS